MAPPKPSTSTVGDSNVIMIPPQPIHRYSPPPPSYRSKASSNHHHRFSETGFDLERIAGDTTTPSGVLCSTQYSLPPPATKTEQIQPTEKAKGAIRLAWSLLKVLWRVRFKSKKRLETETHCNENQSRPEQVSAPAVTQTGNGGQREKSKKLCILPAAAVMMLIVFILALIEFTFTFVIRTLVDQASLETVTLISAE